MATREKNGDFVLESRHLVGLFVLLVVIFGVVFTLGYLMGRSQYDSGIRADSSRVADEPPATGGSSSKAKARTESETPAAKSGPGWDLYHSTEPKTARDPLAPSKNISAAEPAPPPKRIADAPKSLKTTTAPAVVTNSSLVANGAIMLQVAALKGQSDALALAQILQQKKFHAVVLTPGPDKFFRVQVGPYPDDRAATAARRDLEAKGFKAIIKR